MHAHAGYVCLGDFGNRASGCLLQVRNGAMGGINALPYSWCVETSLGDDSDVVMWEFMMKTVRWAFVTHGSSPLQPLAKTNQLVWRSVVYEISLAPSACCCRVVAAESCRASLAFDALGCGATGATVLRVGMFLLATGAGCSLHLQDGYRGDGVMASYEVCLFL